MLFLSIFICWIVAITHTLFRSPEAIVLMPYSIVLPVLLAIPRTLYRFISVLRRRVTMDWVTQMECIGLIAVILNSFGVLFFHVKYPQFQYDRLLHLSGAFLIIWYQALVLIPFRFAESRRRVLAMLGISTFILIFAWEGLQWSQDRLFGSHTFFDYAQPILVDFWEDVAFGALGMALGLWSLISKFPKLLSLRYPHDEAI